jgi:hypothetical protein
MAQKQESALLGSVKRFFESPLTMALVAIMATFVGGELVIPGILGPSPMGQALAAVEQPLALVAIAVIGIHALAAELERLLQGHRHPRPLED